MRLALSLIALFVVITLRADNFVALLWIRDAADVLQKQIPAVAHDGLFEAKRGSAKWTYSFWTKADKTWVEEVRIRLWQQNSDSTNIEVEVVRIEGGLVLNTTKALPDATREWTAKIRELLKKTEPNQLSQQLRTSGPHG